MRSARYVPRLALAVLDGSQRAQGSLQTIAQNIACGVELPMPPSAIVNSSGSQSPTRAL